MQPTPAPPPHRYIVIDVTPGGTTHVVSTWGVLKASTRLPTAFVLNISIDMVGFALRSPWKTASTSHGRRH